MKLLNGFLGWLYNYLQYVLHFTFLPVIHKWFSFSISLSASCFVAIFNFSHSDKHVAISHCGFLTCIILVDICGTTFHGLTVSFEYSIFSFYYFLIYFFSRFQFSSVQLLSCVRLSATSWTTASQASLSITNSQSPHKPMSIELVMPSNHLILCHPLPLLPPIPPSIRVFSNESALHIR